MRIAIFATNPKGIYSGGRYLSLILAYSLQRAGVDTTYITNNLPLFDSDFEPYEALAAPRKIVSPSFELPDDLRADWIIVIPTGGFNDRFYEAALQAAQRWQARLALLSFETPNWFNQMSPYARSPMASQSWRQVVAKGGVVLTIAREGIAPARQFYGAERTDLVYRHWHPPINDLAAGRARPYRDGRDRIVSFVRTEDAHKGAADLLRIDPDVVSGLVLSLVFGRSVDHAYLDAVSRHFAQAPGVTLEVHDRISDPEKYNLLASSKLLLFPSYFEGYGYPPVEAAWMGVPTVAYDLPLLHETVPDSTRFVPPGDTRAFSEAIAQMLAEPQDREAVRAKLAISPDTLSAGWAMKTALQEATAHVRPLASTELVPVALPRSTDPQAETWLKQFEGETKVFNLSSSVDAGRIVIRGQITQCTMHQTLQFALPGVNFHTIRLPNSEDQVHSFEVSGHIETWPSDVACQTCDIFLVECDGETTTKATLPVTADAASVLSRRLAALPLRPLPLNQACALIAMMPLAALFKTPALSLSVAALMETAYKAGIETRLLFHGNTPQITEQTELELLPLFDTIAPSDTTQPGAPLPVTQMLDLLSQGHSLLIQASDVSQLDLALPETVKLYKLGIPGGAEDGLVLLSQKALPARLSEKVESALDAPALIGARRSALGLNAAPVLVLSSPGLITQLSEHAAQILSKLCNRFANLRIVVPKRLSAPDAFEDNNPGANLRVERLEDAQIIAALQTSGVGAGLCLNGMAPDPILTTALSCYADADWVELSEHDGAVDEAGALDALVQKLSRSMASPVLTDVLRRLLPISADRSDFRSLRSQMSTPVSREQHLPRLTRVDGLIFVPPLTQDVPALRAGWDEIGGRGARMSRKSAVLGFRVSQADRNSCEVLSCLIHADDIEDENIEIWLGDRLLTQIVPKKPGLNPYDIAISSETWAPQDDQYLSLHSTQEGNVSLMSVALGNRTPDRVDWDAILPDTDTRAPVHWLLPKAFSTGAHQPMQGIELGTGWHGREATGCWSGQGANTLNFAPPLQYADGAVILTLSGHMFGGDPLSRQRLGVSLGAQRLATAAYSAQKSVRFSVALPEASLAQGISDVFIETPDSFSANSIAINEDVRSLGIFLKTLHLTPVSAQPDQTIVLSKAQRKFEESTVSLTMGPGILQLTGPGAPPKGISFMLAGTDVIAFPRPLGPSGWEASVVVEPTLSDQPCLIMLRALDNGAMVPCPEIQKLEFFGDTANLQPPQATSLVLDTAPMPGDIRGKLPGSGDAASIEITLEDLRHRPQLLESGWSQPEDSHVWSAAAEAKLNIQAGLPHQMSLAILQGGAFLPGNVPFQRCEIGFAPRQKASTVMIRQGAAESDHYIFPLPDRGGVPGGLFFEFPDHVSPQALGLSEDPRDLAFALQGLKIATVTPGAIAPDIRWHHTGYELDWLGTAQGGALVMVRGQGMWPFALQASANPNVIAHPTPIADRVDHWQAHLFCPDVESGKAQTIRILSHPTDPPSSKDDICTFTGPAPGRFGKGRTS